MRNLIDLRNHEDFESLCNELLAAEYLDYQAVSGEGGDGGVDGYRQNSEIVYQFKFSAHRLRPAEYFADFDRVATRKGLRKWILVISQDPTPRLLELAKIRIERLRIEIAILGRTALENLLDKHPNLREKYFPEYAKEDTVVRLFDYVASRDDIRRLEKQTRSMQPNIVHAIPPSESLTPTHRKEITDAAKEIVRSSRAKIQFPQILAMLKNRFQVDNWYWIHDHEFPNVMQWLNDFKYGARDQYGPLESSTRLKGVIQSQKRELGLSDKQYRHHLVYLTGQDSTTRMDLKQLQKVRDYFNLLIDHRR